MPVPFLKRLRLAARVLTRSSSNTLDPDWLLGAGWSVPTLTGVHIDQQTAMSCAAVMACVTIKSEDLAKLTPSLFKLRTDTRGGRDVVAYEQHPVAKLLEEPNDYQTWFEFASMMQAAKELRGNAYAAIVRNGRGDPVYLVPLNPDWVSLWQSPDGSLFYMVTRVGLHMMAMLKNQPLLIPARDILHIKGLSSNGLLGMSRISVCREALGLSLAQEKQAAMWMGSGAKPSGVLQTDAKLTPDAAKRMAQDWMDVHAGILNSGKIAVLEQGLKWTQLQMTAQDIEFIASRKFQLEEIARIFRVPLYMIGEMSRSTGSTLTQLSQEYVNYTISSELVPWAQRWRKTFDLRKDGMIIDFDMSVLLKGDMVSRYGANRLALQGWKTVNEIRVAEGDNPVDDPTADQIFRPANMAPLDSDIFNAQALPGEGEPGSKDIGSENGGENIGAGKPAKKKPNADQKP